MQGTKRDHEIKGGIVFDLPKALNRNWPPRYLVRLKGSVCPPNFVLTPNVDKWCRANFRDSYGIEYDWSGPSHTGKYFAHKGRIVISDKTDAFAFKLRWL